MQGERGDGKTGISRRGFIRASLGAGAGIGFMRKASAAAGRITESVDNLRIREYRTLGRTGFEVSDIGIGAGNLSNPDVLAAALDAGVNYIDTAEHYARGNSERTVGDVLKNYDRKKIFITTKLNFAMGGRRKETLRKRFLRCLERLQTDYADCLMIHMTPSVDQIRHEPYHELIRELKAEGKVRFSGLSNHGVRHSLAGPTTDDMDTVVLAAAEDGRFDVVLFAYNFIQREKGEKILKACREKNMGTTLMKTNPVKFNSDMKVFFDRAEERGRKLPDRVIRMIEDYREFVAPAAEAFKSRYGLESPEQVRDAAIKFVLSNPDVHAACPTINSFEDLNAYLSLSGQRLEPRDAAVLNNYEGVYGRYYCRHACGECEPACPHGVPVNTVMRYAHYFEAQGREKHAVQHYAGLKGMDASACSTCAGPCEAACPHGVPIQGLLIAAHENLSL